MKTIAIVNHKGGVGKTTTAFNFGYELARRNKKVLLIDFDMQANLSSAFGIEIWERDDHSASISDAIEDAMAERVIKPIVYDYPGMNTLDIIPCDIRMANTILRLNSVVARELYLKAVLDAIKESVLYRNYDYCIIDCAPSVMVDFQNALVAADEILIVANPDTFSTNGMKSLLTEYQKVKKYFKPELKIAGVLINNADNRTIFTKEMVELIKEAWKEIHVFHAVIPQSIRVKESILMHLPIWEYEKDNPVAIAYSSFTDEYLGGNI